MFLVYASVFICSSLFGSKILRNTKIILYCDNNRLSLVSQFRFTPRVSSLFMRSYQRTNFVVVIQVYWIKIRQTLTGLSLWFCLHKCFFLWHKRYHVLCLHFKMAPFQIATYETDCIPCLNPWNEFFI